MTDDNTFVLEKSWRAQTGRVWQIDFQQSNEDEGHYYYLFTCTRVDEEEGEGFVFTPQVSKRLLQEMGIDYETKPKLVMRVVAGRGMEDLKVRLNAGHDHNFNDLPYCKTYTTRDAEKLKKYLPK